MAPIGFMEAKMDGTLLVSGKNMHLFVEKSYIRITQGLDMSASHAFLNIHCRISILLNSLRLLERVELASLYFQGRVKVSSLHTLYIYLYISF